MTTTSPLAAEVIVLLDETVLEVRYLEPGRRFRAGPTQGADLAWPATFALASVDARGRIAQPADAGPLRPLAGFGDGTEGDGFELALGRLRVRVRPSAAPTRRALSPRRDRTLGVILFPLLLTAFAAGMTSGSHKTRSLRIDPELARSVHLDVPSSPTTPRPERVGRVRAALNPFAIGQSWVGTYLCPQGERDLSLWIGSVAGNIVDVVSVFDDATTSAGRFAMRGTFSATGHITFSTLVWSDRPPGYVLIRIDGTATVDTFSGTVNGTGCGPFSLRLMR
jgi:hypothetical protein